jgi:hypothetical protein
VTGTGLTGRETTFRDTAPATAVRWEAMANTSYATNDATMGEHGKDRVSAPEKVRPVLGLQNLPSWAELVRFY